MLLRGLAAAGGSPCISSFDSDKSPKRQVSHYLAPLLMTMAQVCLSSEPGSEPPHERLFSPASPKLEEKTWLSHAAALTSTSFSGLHSKGGDLSRPHLRAAVEADRGHGPKPALSITGPCATRVPDSSWTKPSLHEQVWVLMSRPSWQIQRSPPRSLSSKFPSLQPLSQPRTPPRVSLLQPQLSPQLFCSPGGHPVCPHCPAPGQGAAHLLHHVLVGLNGILLAENLVQLAGEEPSAARGQDKM